MTAPVKVLHFAAPRSIDEQVLVRLAARTEGITAAFGAAHAAVRLLGERFHAWAVNSRGKAHKRARCRICSPTANPYRLPINGAEYRRRRRSRRR